MSLDFQREISIEKKLISLKNLFLDPNNYRFIDNGNYLKVAEQDIFKEEIQKRTLQFIRGENNHEIKDLIQSLKANGYLPVDQIQARKIDDNKYLVVEGNRRVATLKFLQEEFFYQHDIGNLEKEIFSKVPIVIYDQVDETHHQILMGLKHISGNKKWPAVNQAKLLKDLRDQGMDENRIKDALGITTVQLRRYLRALALVDEYKKSDFGEQFKSDMFTIFDEIIKKPTLKEWLGWDDDNYCTTKSINKERLFSWLSEDEKSVSEDDEFGEKIKLEKIITRGDDLRELAKIITDDKAIEKMETSRSLSQAYLASDKMLTDRFTNALELIDNELTTAFKFIDNSDKTGREKLENINKKFNGLLVAKGYSDLLENQSIQRTIYFNAFNSQFSEISFKSYKNLNNVKLKNINRINIIAGENNSGKSSLLEGIYLLCKQNDIHSFFDILRRRGKFYAELPSVWIDSEFSKEISISGVFSGQLTSIEISKSSADDEDFDKYKYLSTIEMLSKFNNEQLESKAHLFEHKSNQFYFKSIKNLCNSFLSSPFSILSNADLNYSWNCSIETKSKEQIVNFITNHVDGFVTNIDLSTQIRFQIAHNKFDRAVDLTQFGDGMQRIFQIALLFAASKNGVLFIDEFENAIHYSLLKKFASFIFELAELFNVQVFITSHSRECINAFFDESLDLNKISGYHLSVKDNQVIINHEQGKYFSTLITNFDADLR